MLNKGIGSSFTDVLVGAAVLAFVARRAQSKIVKISKYDFVSFRDEESGRYTRKLWLVLLHRGLLSCFCF